jgi:acetylornithine deacetylase/succinyl-diaminopimelate desuccinylase-like protein
VPMLDASISDARFFARLGIQTYGFVPMRLPAAFDRYRLVHAPDERVPLEALTTGAEALFRALPRILAAQLGSPSGQGTGLHLSLGG